MSKLLAETLCIDLAQALAGTNRKLVMAESCTAGRAAAILGTVAGISEHFCGSAVTYRNATKAGWLGVGRDLLEDPGPVSSPVVRQMVTGVLACTPEADLAAAITGHLGPDAPPRMDGLVYLAVGWAADRAEDVDVQSVTLSSRTRADRQLEAAEQLLKFVLRIVRAAQ